MIITAKQNQSIFDIALQLGARVEHAFVLAYVNDISVSDVLASGQSIQVPQALPVYESNPLRVIPMAVPAFYTKNITAETSFLDVAISSTGNLANAFAIAYASKMSVTQFLQKDTRISIPALEKNRTIMKYFKNNNINVSSSIGTVRERYSVFDDTFDLTFE